ncbi:hypothetical protein L1267_19090 [Pseudoalteromonas sp. OFAV1]|uniref:hypothetical protein n=1 Tax=Pseudoalteromonas sp. OFAV1 TaxID=2908892 RepID=UPI001F232BFF|nr:hypothetical protein [Pseudoalteromonas sp. OFAV1]MCF2902480.1 hypothetical protein [Pseudoalteromonas sp. OFAV1]
MSTQSAVFSNQYGKVILTPVTEFMPVSRISYEKITQVADNLQSITDLEKVALITENKYTQSCFPMALNFKHGYVVLHNKKNMRQACVCSVKIESFNIPSGRLPHEEIESLKPSTQLAFAS